MCGIVGVWGQLNNAQATIWDMLQAIAHRGPDEEIQLHVDKYHAGMCRLSINDIKNGSQPLYNTNRDVSLLYNGEIYNYHELRNLLERKGYVFRTNCDGEVICHLYDEYGLELFSLLDGMFAVSLYDHNKRTVFLSRDEIGEKPLYFSTTLGDSKLVFASEIKAINSVNQGILSINEQALWDMPTFLWIPEPDTIYKEVQALPAGHVLSFDGSTIKIKKYGEEPNRLEPVFTNNIEAIEKTRQVIDEAIERRLLSDVPIGCFLSGGLDSSIVAAVSSSILGELDTFNVAFEDIDDPHHGKADESAQARWFAKQLGTKHHQVNVTASSFMSHLEKLSRNGDQPFAVSSGLGILAISSAARDQGIKVLLSGDCADEAFGGYSWYKYLNLSEASKREKGRSDVPISFQNTSLSAEERAAVISNYNAHDRAWAWHYYAHENEKRALFANDFSLGKQSSFRFFSKHKEDQDWSPLDFIENDRDFYMTNEMLTKLDRMTMAFSVEGRVPFASKKVQRHARRLEYSQLIKKDSLKWVLREAYRDVLPDELINRPKHGFNVPIDSWLRNDWSELLRHTFSNESALKKMGFIDSSAFGVAKQFLNSEAKLHGHTLFSFIMINKWLEDTR